MRLIINKSLNPAFNLALEEYLLTQTDFDVIMLWRNSKAVIIGNNQNAFEEVNVDYVRDHNIAVIRRLSGGGAVFHDPGNINFTVIHALGGEDFSNYAKFTAPICEFLHTLGVGAKLEGRNDLVIDGMKFSGNAQAVRNNRILHHGTILYDADFGALAGSLKPRDAKIAGKGIKSVRARVTNVASHLKDPMPPEEFFERLAGYFRGNAGDITEYTLAEADIVGTERLVDEKYSKWEWNFGKSPDYTYEKSAKLECGLIDLRLKASGGVIEEARIFGDFFGMRDKSELEAALTGVRHDREAVGRAIEKFDLHQYIHGISRDELLDMF